jgi:DNA-binding MarR family transcriptional regulator
MDDERLDNERLAGWISLVLTQRVIAERLNARLAQAGAPSAPELELLGRLNGTDGGRLRMVDLASVLMVSKSGVTRLIDRLVAKGLVERHSPPDNRRIVYAEITDLGRSTLDESAGKYIAVIDDAIGDHLTEADVKTLRRLLRKVLEGNGGWDDERCSPALSDISGSAGG